MLGPRKNPVKNAAALAQAMLGVSIMLIDDLDTPVPTVDLDRVAANLARAAAYFKEHGLAVRPHIKTHKIVELARQQVALGARGITCQKLGEAEIMADGGIADILLSFPIVGSIKYTRFMALAHRIDLLSVTDSIEIADRMGELESNVGLLVECDVGGRRCGVQTPAQALALARHIDRNRNLRFLGLMTYPPKNQIETTRAFLTETLDLLHGTGLAAPIVSVGGTPEMYRAHEIGVSTEHRPGTYIYSDRYMVENGIGTFADCALTIIATVVSRPTDDRAIIDAGSKTLSSDLMGFSDHGYIVEYPLASLAKLSEEHGHIDLSRSQDKPKIGERLTIIPNHACVVSNLFDAVQAVADRHFVKTLKVDARGRVR
jgi:D-serine deaminase-like pyridoxal phosphate-dependent protein